MMTHTTTLGPIQVIGIALRTQNREGPAPIASHWERFFAEQILEKIPNKKNNRPIALYTDYASDENGLFTLIIGCEVHKIGAVPQGMTARKIPRARYVSIQAHGPFPDCIVDAWKWVWKASIKRTFIADFELYPAGSLDPARAEIELLIGVV